MQNLPHQITKLSQRIWFSPRIREELSNSARKKKPAIASDVLIRPVKTRWNTMVQVLERAIVLREPLHDICKMLQFNKKGMVHLDRFNLDDDEWEMIGQLHALLEVGTVQFTLEPFPTSFACLL